MMFATCRYEGIKNRIKWIMKIVKDSETPNIEDKLHKILSIAMTKQNIERLI